MVGYWKSFFFHGLMGYYEIQSRSTKIHCTNMHKKRTKLKYPVLFMEQAWSVKDLLQCIWLKEHFSGGREQVSQVSNCKNSAI